MRKKFTAQYILFAAISLLSLSFFTWMRRKDDEPVLIPEGLIRARQLVISFDSMDKLKATVESKPGVIVDKVAKIITVEPQAGSVQILMPCPPARRAMSCRITFYMNEPFSSTETKPLRAVVNSEGVVTMSDVGYSVSAR